jgi:hypothetical protein
MVEAGTENHRGCELSKTWKIGIGVVAAAVVIVGVALSVWGIVTFRNRGYAHGWMPGAHGWEPEVATQLEVDLVDDDGDGVPDRGVIGIPQAAGFGRGCGMPFGPFGFAQGGFARGSRHFGRGFGPRPPPHCGRSGSPGLPCPVGRWCRSCLPSLLGSSACARTVPAGGIGCWLGSTAVTVADL